MEHILSPQCRAGARAPARRAVRFASATLVTLALAACGDEPPLAPSSPAPAGYSASPEASGAASVKIERTGGDLVVWSRVQLKASAFDASGNLLASAPVRWTASPSSAVRFSATTGSAIEIELLKTGTVTITATSGSAKAKIELKVEAPVPTYITLSQSGWTTTVGTKKTITVRVLDSRGRVIPTAPVCLTSSNDKVASVLDARASSSGLLATIGALAPGEATVVAKSGNLSTELKVNVSASSVRPNFTIRSRACWMGTRG